MNYKPYPQIPNFLTDYKYPTKALGISNELKINSDALLRPIRVNTTWNQAIFTDSLSKIHATAAVPSIIKSINPESLGIGESIIRSNFSFVSSVLGDAINNSFIDSIVQKSTFSLKFSEDFQNSLEQFSTEMAGFSERISKLMQSNITVLGDFRKNILIDQTINDLEDYSNIEMLEQDISELKSTVFNLRKENSQIKTKVQKLEEKDRIKNFEIDTSSMRLDDLEKSKRVSQVVTWFSVVIQVYGVNLDYETTRVFLESLVTQIKILIEKY